MREQETPNGFEALDPAWEDPGYWDRFQVRTLALVAPELVRRRQALERMTVADVVLSWSRAVVPMAVAAGAAALIVLSADATATESEAPGPDGSAAVRSGMVGSPTVPATEGSVGEGEELDAAVDGGPIRAVAEEDPDDMSVVLTVAIEGF
ncbi:MAG: hypothetical protein ACLFWG_09855 [Longimicrobiales bacterium]